MLQLLEGEGISIPKPGQRNYFIDTDGVLKEVKSDGTRGPVTGDLGWRVLQWQRAQAILGNQIDDYISSHLLNPNEYDISAGTSPFAQLAGSDGGVVKNGAGTATLMFAGHKSAAGSIVPVSSIKTKAWAISSKFRFDATPTGAGIEIDIAGMLGSTQYLTLQMANDTSTSVLQLAQIGAGTTRLALDSKGTLGGGIAAGNWFDGMLLNDVANGRVIAQINGLTAATQTTLTNSTTQAGRPFFDTAQNSSVSIDAIFFAFKQEL